MSISQKRVILLGILVLALLIATFIFFLPKGNSTAKPQQQAKGTTVRTGTSGLAVHVSGNQLVNATGQSIHLVGVNVIAGNCIPRPNIPLTILLDGTSDATAAGAIAQWHANVVRITLNEDCWLGINGVDPHYTGTIYRTTIMKFVNLLHTYGIYAIVDLHASAPGNYLAANGQVMADKDHALAYWQSVASTFKNDPAVIFEPYNEPRITTFDTMTTNPWQCWRDGCTVTVVFGMGNKLIATNTSWQGAGMQSLVNAIRSTGATNPILLGGLNLSEDLRQFLRYLPSDPQHQLIANYHNYQGGRNTQTYWNTIIAKVAQQMPVITSEFGEKDCQTTFVNQYMQWADQHNISYIPWVWTDWQCDAYGLIADWNGTPNAYGQAFYNHFHSVNP